MSAVLTQRLKGIADRRRARSDCQAGYAALQRRDALLEHVLGGVGQAAVDVARVGQAEARCGVLTVAEYVGRGGVNRHRTGIGRRIGGLLANVELKGFKLVIRHDDASFLLLNASDGFVWFALPGSHSSEAEIGPHQLFKVETHVLASFRRIHRVAMGLYYHIIPIMPIGCI